LGAAFDVSRRWFLSPEGIATEWAGILAGPIALAAQQLASYALVKWTCGHQHTSVLHLISLGALVIVAGGAFAAWRALDEAPADSMPDGGRAFDRGRFMGVLGLALSALFAVAVIFMSIAPWMIDACE
jgi:hypothetical protein